MSEPLRVLELFAGISHQAGSVYDPEGIGATLDTMSGGNREPLIVASRGRSHGEWNNSRHFQQLELRLDGLTNSLSTVQKDNYVAIRNANKRGYDLATDGDSINTQYPTSKTRRGRVGHGVAQTIQTEDTIATVQGYNIRKLTPKECWRLMGFDDEDFEKASKVNSNAQLYKQAGNSIVVDVLEKILTNLLEEEKWQKQISPQSR